MSLQYGPHTFSKLITGSKVTHIKKHKNQDIILLSTQKQTLECHYLKKTNKKQPSLLKMKQLHLDYQQSTSSSSHVRLFGITNKHIVYCQDNIMKINNKYEHKHQSKIGHLLIDSNNIALTTAGSCIRISSIEDNRVQGVLKDQGQDVSEVFWNNSLVISGNKAGVVNVWDINKQHIITTKRVSHTAIDLIDVYTDLLQKNIYYTWSKDEKKAYIFDLRTSSKIATIQNLPRTTLNIQHNKSGKIFIMSQNQLSFIDIYKGYNIIGKFTQVKQQFQQKFIPQHPNTQIYHRRLNNMLIWDQYVLLGCSNGCIEVYNSDLYTCCYSFGMGEYSGIKQILRVGDSLIGLEDNGDMEIARMT